MTVALLGPKMAANGNENQVALDYWAIYVTTSS